MQRTLEWMRSENFEGFGCSQCDWKFKPLGVLTSYSLEEMKRNYEALRDKEFAAHTCVKRTGPADPKAK
jgi:hypothetical protein